MMRTLHHDEHDVTQVFDAMVTVTDYDSFAEKDMELFFGDDYEQPITEQMLQVVSRMTGLPVWHVRNIMLDDITEARYINGEYHFYCNGKWSKPIWKR